MGLKIVQVDAFTAEPFAGNPAAVCLLPEPREEGWMQRVAREMNLSETAFLVRRPDGFDLRWFTPKAEVDLCGHATLASAHVLWEEGQLRGEEEARFHTRSGRLTARREGGWIGMDFPAVPEEETPPPPDLEEALGAPARYVDRNRLDHLVLLVSESVLRSLRPNFSLLERICARGVIVTAGSDREEFDFLSRYFAPGFGVPEDPVTGSAHCCLGPFWGKRLGKTALVGYQASERGGVVKVRLAGPRVFLSGQAVTVFRGELT